MVTGQGDWGEAGERPRDRVFELRRYTLRPGQRETLIALFDREFVETQEAVGMSVIGQFRDLDQPDHFVWFRGFPDMERRRDALSAFYGGPVWAEHGPAANATMLDSNDVLLLKPAAPGAGFPEMAGKELGKEGALNGGAPILVVIHHLAPEANEAEAAAIAEAFSTWAGAAGAEIIASLISERRQNTYPRLPVREGEPVVVTVLRASELAAKALARGPVARGELVRRCHVARLVPTAGSRLRG